MYDSPTTIVLCSEPDDIMTVTGIELMPDPPVRGQNLSVIAKGILQEDIHNVSYIIADVKKGILHLPKVRIPICDYVTTGCPVTKDRDSIEMVFDIPKYVPGGQYQIQAVLYNADLDVPKLTKMDICYGKKYKLNLLNRLVNGLSVVGDRIACMQAEIEL